jgi:D-methionine transport system substrate-binding protein
VKEGNEESEKIQALVKALTSQAVKDFINNTYAGAVVPIF